MRFQRTGSPEQSAILFLHGLSATAESCYGEVSRLLQDKWQIVLCEFDGHYSDSPAFSRIDDACAQIEAYVQKNMEGHIHGLVGLSLGGTVAVSLLGRGNIQADRTLLDAAFCVDMGILRGFYSFIFPTGVGRIRDGKKIPAFLLDSMMGKGNRSVTEMLYPGITEETCKNACREIYSYRIPKGLKDTSSCVEFWRGSAERYPEKSAALLKGYLPDMTERVFPNSGHCQFLHEHPNSYAKLLDEYMRKP